MKPYSTIACGLFALIAAAHLARLLCHADVTVAGFSVPMWVSLVGMIIAAVLAFGLWRESKS